MFNLTFLIHIRGRVRNTCNASNQSNRQTSAEASEAKTSSPWEVDEARAEFTRSLAPDERHALLALGGSHFRTIFRASSFSVYARNSTKPRIISAQHLFVFARGFHLVIKSQSLSSAGHFSLESVAEIHLVGGLSGKVEENLR